MKRFVPFACSLILGLLPLGAQPAGPKAVYLMPMNGGIDQYLASWLTKERILQVTADPNAADLVMTDRLNTQLEHKLEELHPRDSDPEADDSPRNFRGGQSRGTLFLLDAKTRNVVWSEYRKSGSASPSSLNREARNLALKLRTSLTK